MDCCPAMHKTRAVKPLLHAGILALLGCFASVVGAPAQVSNAPTPAASPTTGAVTILFVGNSFLHGKYLPLRAYNAGAIKDENFGLPRSNPRAELAEPGPYGGIPGIFKQLTGEMGLMYDVHVEAISAQTLEFHYRHALPVIAQAGWDAVVLQDYSTGPLPARRGGHPERFYKYATLLEQAIHAADPRARLYLYETWPRADLIFPDHKPYSGETIDAMTRDLHDAYGQEAAQDAHFTAVAPVGDAWQRAIQAGVAQENPFQSAGDGRMDLWAVDNYHPSVEGAYLAALVLFQQITGEDARRLGENEQAAAALGIPPAAAVSLQRVASEQVVSAGIANTNTR
jgi:hypothetical protein